MLSCDNATYPSFRVSMLIMLCIAAGQHLPGWDVLMLIAAWVSHMPMHWAHLELVQA